MVIKTTTLSALRLVFVLGRWMVPPLSQKRFYTGVHAKQPDTVIWASFSKGLELPPREKQVSATNVSSNAIEFNEQGSFWTKPWGAVRDAG